MLMSDAAGDDIRDTLEEELMVRDIEVAEMFDAP
jgi:hypothetical protein